MTVRNEANFVVQFAYGGDNFDGKKIEKQQFELVKGSDNDFNNKYKWNSSEFSIIDKSIKVNKRLIKREYLSLKRLRKFYREKNYHIENIIYLPLNVYRIVQQAKSHFSLEDNNISDIDPKYLLNEIKKLNKLIRLNCNPNYPYNEINDYNLHLLRTLIQSKLSTKVIIYENRLTKEALDWVIKTIQERFYKSLIHPGEAVGPIAAQSIGEPCTQLSVVADTKVKVSIYNKYDERKIGNLIDIYMNEHIDKVITTHITEDGKESHILPIPKEWNIRVPGLNYEKETIEWNRVTEFSRHPPNGKLIKIRTKSGREVIATPSHSFVTKKNGKVQTIRGDMLNIGDVVPIMNNTF